MSSSIISASVAVDKATSELLLGPDWALNMKICDSVNSHYWLGVDVMKTIKKRLQHKSPKVQLLALTLLETMVKNCGDFLHPQIAEKCMLEEMVKIVRKKGDMQVRNKILVLLDSWREAFEGKYRQYHWAYEGLRRSGVQFPNRSQDTALMFTPPDIHPMSRQSRSGRLMPGGSFRRLDETMAVENGTLNVSSLNSMRDVMELLNDMLQAVDHKDCVAVKDEVIVDLVEQCRSNQKKLMQTLTTTGDENLLARGLELNDTIQGVLAKHDAIASGSPLLLLAASSALRPTEDGLKPDEAIDSSPNPGSGPPVPLGMTINTLNYEEEEEEEDDFTQLAKRHSKPDQDPSQSESAENYYDSAPEEITKTTVTTSVSDPAPSNALALIDPPVPAAAKDQAIIDLLNLTLSTTVTPQESPSTPNENIHLTPLSADTPMNQHNRPGSQEPIFNSYVVPWAQPRPQSQPGMQGQFHFPNLMPYPSPSPPEAKCHQYSHLSYLYPPRPWASPDPLHTQRNISLSTMVRTSQSNVNSHCMPMRANGLNGVLQHSNSLPVRGRDWAPMSGDPENDHSLRQAGMSLRQKPYVPPYRLFEELNVFSNADGRFKVANNSAEASLSGIPGQSMISGRK